MPVDGLITAIVFEKGKLAGKSAAYLLNLRAFTCRHGYLAGRRLTKWRFITESIVFLETEEYVRQRCGGDVSHRWPACRSRPHQEDIDVVSPIKQK